MGGRIVGLVDLVHDRFYLLFLRQNGGSDAAWTKLRFPACVWIRKTKNWEEEKNNRKWFRWNGKSAEFGEAETEDGSRRLRRRRCDALMFDDEGERGKEGEGQTGRQEDR